MATLTIRQLDDELYERLRNRARANKRSLEAEARVILENATPRRDPNGGRDLVAELISRYERAVAEEGFDEVSSVDLIRAVRDEE